MPQTLEQAEFIRHWPRYRRSWVEPPAVSSERDLRERFVGCLLGLAVGDALSVPTHYQRAGTFEALSDLAGGGVFALPRGHWTDDTALSLCVAKSLLECKAFDIVDQVQRFGRWQSRGYLAAGRHCAGITPFTARALHRRLKDAPMPALAEGLDNREPAPLSRAAPIVMFHYSRPIQAVALAAEAASAFEAAGPVPDAMRLLAAMVAQRAAGRTAGAGAAAYELSVFGSDALSPALEALLERDPTLPPTGGSEPVLFALAAARWALAGSGSFRAGALRASNFGGDSDVIGSVHGQIAGAFYGHASIPSAWLGALARQSEIEILAERLFAAAGSGPVETPAAPAA